jgi:ribosome maturation factor RimP
MMISEEKIRQLVEEKVSPKDHFIVDVKVLPGNRINILLDNDKGLSIQDCVEVSRFVESNLNREEEDFELEVSSPGLDQPFKVLKQYLKYVGRQVQITTKDGKKTEGKLVSVSDQEIIIEEQYKERIPGRKAKQLITSNHNILFDNIKETKIIISFN